MLLISLSALANCTRPSRWLKPSCHIAALPPLLPFEAYPEPEFSPEVESSFERYLLAGSILSRLAKSHRSRTLDYTQERMVATYKHIIRDLSQGITTPLPYLAATRKVPHKIAEENLRKPWWVGVRGRRVIPPSERTTTGVACCLLICSIKYCYKYLALILSLFIVLSGVA